MRIGYIRVLTVDQEPTQREIIMERLGVDKLFMDKYSRKNKDRPGMDEMMAFVREGDVLVVESFSQFARSMKDLILLIKELNRKQVQFVSQKESLDTSTLQGKFVLEMFGALAQLEHEIALQRQAEGIAIAKAEGRYKGRKPIAVDEERMAELYAAWKRGDTVPKLMMKALGLKPATFWRKVRAYEVKHGIRKE